MNDWKGKRVFGVMYWLRRGHFIVYVPTQALTTMRSVWKWWFPQKDTKVLCRNPEGCNTCTRKGGKQPVFADLRSSGLQSHTSFLPWVELLCIPPIFCFSDGYQLSFLSSAKKRTWPMPASCHQARAVWPSLSAVVLSAGESHLVSSTVQEPQVASCVQAFHRVEEWRPLSRCRHATQAKHIWLWPRAMILRPCCVPGSPVTECPMYAKARTTTVRETYNTMKSDICFISLTQHKHPALILHQENATSIYFFQAYCAE